MTNEEKFYMPFLPFFSKEVYMRRLVLLCTLILAPMLSHGKDRLYAGESLTYNVYLMSPNGQYYMTHTPAGLLAIYRADGSKRYQMSVYGDISIMQHDGNYVQYYSGTEVTGQAVWATNTGGRCPCASPHYLRLWDNGNLSIEFGEVPMAPPYYGNIWVLGPDPTPLTTKTGMEEYDNPGSRPASVPDPYLPSSYAY